MNSWEQIKPLQFKLITQIVLRTEYLHLKDKFDELLQKNRFSSIQHDNT